MIREEQFVRLIVRHEGELRAFAATLMPSRTDADDVLQDAFVAMWRRIADLKDEAVFRTWAYTFVRFTALNRIRKERRRPLVFSEPLVALLAEEGEQEADRTAAEIRALTTCLEKLPVEKRELLQHYYASAKTRMTDVARTLGRSIAALYKSLERTREALKTCIEFRLAEDGFDVAGPIP